MFSVAVLPTGFIISTVDVEQRNFMQFHPVVIAVSPLNALNQIDARNKNVSRKTYSFLKVKLRQSLRKSGTKTNMIFVQRTVLANSANQIAGPGITIWNASKQHVQGIF